MNNTTNRGGSTKFSHGAVTRAAGKVCEGRGLRKNALGRYPMLKQEVMSGGLSTLLARREPRRWGLVSDDLVRALGLLLPTLESRADADESRLV